MPQVPFSTFIADMQLAASFMMAELHAAVERKHHNTHIQKAALTQELARMKNELDGADGRETRAQAGHKSMLLLRLLLPCTLATRQFWGLPRCRL